MNGSMYKVYVSYKKSRLCSSLWSKNRTRGLAELGSHVSNRFIARGPKSINYITITVLFWMVPPILPFGSFSPPTVMLTGRKLCHGRIFKTPCTTKDFRDIVTSQKSLLKAQLHPTYQIKRYEPCLDSLRSKGSPSNTPEGPHLGAKSWCTSEALAPTVKCALPNALEPHLWNQNRGNSQRRCSPGEPGTDAACACYRCMTGNGAFHNRAGVGGKIHYFLDTCWESHLQCRPNCS